MSSLQRTRSSSANSPTASAGSASVGVTTASGNAHALSRLPASRPTSSSLLTKLGFEGDAGVSTDDTGVVRHADGDVDILNSFGSKPQPRKSRRLPTLSGHDAKLGTELAHGAHVGHHLLSHGKHAVTHPTPPATGLSATLSKGLGVATAGVGLSHMIKGVKDNDLTYYLQGGAEVTSGTATTVAASGVSTATATALGTTAMGTAGFAAGVMTGRYGDQKTRDLCYLQDKDGGCQSLSDRIANGARDAHDWAGGGLTGHLAGLATGVLMLPGAVPLALGGALVGGYHDITGGLGTLQLDVNSLGYDKATLDAMHPADRALIVKHQVFASTYKRVLADAKKRAAAKRKTREDRESHDAHDTAMRFGFTDGSDRASYERTHREEVENSERREFAKMIASMSSPDPSSKSEEGPRSTSSGPTSTKPTDWGTSYGDERTPGETWGMSTAGR